MVNSIYWFSLRRSEDWNHYCNVFFMVKISFCTFCHTKGASFPSCFISVFPWNHRQSDPTFGAYLKKNATFHGSWESAKICSGHGRAGLHSNGKNHYLLNRKNTSSSLVHFFIWYVGLHGCNFQPLSTAQTSWWAVFENLKTAAVFTFRTRQDFWTFQSIFLGEKSHARLTPKRLSWRVSQSLPKLPQPRRSFDRITPVP